MIQEKKFPNNFAYPGTNALMYNVFLTEFLTNNGSFVDESFDGHITDIGLEWKRSDSDEWNEVSLKFPSSGDYFFSFQDFIFGNSENMSRYSDVYGYERQIDDNYRCQMYFGNYSMSIHPVRVLIKHLDNNTSYDLRSYYTLDYNDKHTYNSQTISTLGQGLRLTYDISVNDVVWDYHVTQEQIDEYIVKLQNSVNDFIEILEMFFPEDGYTGVSTEHYIELYYSASGEAATASGNGLRINIYYSLRDNYDFRGMTSIITHEEGHNIMESGYDSIDYPTEEMDKIIKMMEFATNSPYAGWKWLGGHNYPLISSSKYPYLDNCVIVCGYYCLNM